MSGVTTDTGPFAIVPEWVLSLSGNAVKLYAVLRRFEGPTGDAWPSRKTLAARMDCSVDTVDRVIRELREAGALEIQHRFDDGGDMTSNMYHVLTVRPGSRADAATGGREIAATGSRADAAQNESHLERKPIERESVATRRLRKVFKPLTDDQSAKIREDFRALPNLEETIAYALAHVAHSKCSDENLYLRHWLRGEVARMPALGRRKEYGQPGAPLGSTLEQRKAAYGTPLLGRTAQ